MNEKIVITSNEAFHAPAAPSETYNQSSNTQTYSSPVAPASSGESSTPGVLAIVFILLLALGATAAYMFSSSDNSRQAISKVLERDHQLASQKIPLNKFSESEDPDAFVNAVAASMKKYAQTASRFDANAVPTDFADAYRKHLRAWEKVANVVANHPYFGTFADNLLEGFFRGLMGDVTGGAFIKQDAITNWAYAVDTAFVDVNNSWSEVERIALKYGVEVQK